MSFLECCEDVAAGGSSSVLILQPITLLPDNRAPEMLICLTPDRRWLAVSRDGLQVLEDGAEVRLQGQLWRMRDIGSHSPVLCFRISQDEEHVGLKIVLGNATVDLGERVHHQCLLLLARERRDDSARGIAQTECGWRHVDTLAQMLGVDVQHLNIHIFRARRQLEPVMRNHRFLQELVERRSGQVRLGIVDFEVGPYVPARRA